MKGKANGPKKLDRRTIEYKRANGNSHIRITLTDAQAKHVFRLFLREMARGN